MKLSEEDSVSECQVQSFLLLLSCHSGIPAKATAACVLVSNELEMIRDQHVVK